MSATATATATGTATAAGWTIRPGVALAALDQSNDLIVVLDHAGTIIVTNAPWREGALQRGATVSTTGPGVNYVDFCERSDEGVVADGIRAVLTGGRLHFEHEYACHSSIADAHYVMNVSPLGTPGSGALVTHRDITAQALTSRWRVGGRGVDPVTLLPTTPAGITDLAHKLADTQAQGRALAVVTVTFGHLGEIQPYHGRRLRDDLIVHAVSRVLRLTRDDDEMIRPSTDQLVLFASVADAHGAEFLRERIAQTLSVPYLVGSAALSSPATVTVTVSDRFSTLESLLGDIATAPGHVGADVGRPSDVVTANGSVGTRPVPLRNVDGVETAALAVYTLPDGALQTANAAAQTLLGLNPGGSAEIHPHEPVDRDEARQVGAAMAALGSGAIVSLRTRRTSTTAEGPKALHTSVRRMEIGGDVLAVSLTVEADPDADPQAIEQRLAGALVAGTTDAAGVVTTVSATTNPMEGALTAALRGPLRGTVHPDDLGVFDWMIESMRHGRPATGNVRLSPAHYGWVSCQIQLFTLTRKTDQPPATSAKATDGPYTFVVSTVVDTSSVTEQLSRLEAHLGRIGSAWHAAQCDLGLSEMPDRSTVAILDGVPLTSRQREIVERLARGQRVGSIASALYISRSTVRNHLAQVYRLLGVHSQQELLEVVGAA